MRGKIKNWRAEWRTAASGFILATRQPAFLASMLLGFFIFGTLMSLLSGGTAGVSLMLHSSFPAALNILAKAFFGLFGVGRNFSDWLLVFAVSLLQAVVIGLLVLVYRLRKKSPDNAQRASLAASLAVLGTGCPTCGTTLLMPVLTATIGSGSMALAGAVSGVLTAAAVLVLLYTFKKLGQEAYSPLIAIEFNKKEPK